jgi:hypothetical protein
VGLDQYIASGCDGFMGWATMLSEVNDITWSLTMDELLTLSYSLQTLVSETLLLLLSTVIYCSPCFNRL